MMPKQLMSFDAVFHHTRGSPLLHHQGDHILPAVKGSGMEVKGEDDDHG